MNLIPHFHSWDYFSNTYTVELPEDKGVVNANLHFRRCKKCRKLEIWRGGWAYGEYLPETREWLLNSTKETGIILKAVQL